MEDKMKIRKKLQSENSFNPFNDGYEWKKLKGYLDSEKIESVDDGYAIKIAMTSEIYQSYYSQYVEYIKEAIEETGGSLVDIISNFLGMANMDLCRMSLMMAEEGGMVSLMDAAHYGVESPIEHFDKMNAVGAIEGQVDFANVLLNILRHTPLNMEAVSPDMRDRLRTIHKMYVASNLLYYTKESYDAALWENGYIERNGDKLKVKYIDTEYPIVRHIGNIRSGNNILAGVESIKYLSSMDRRIRENYFMKGRSAQILGEVWLDEKGYVQYSLMAKENSYEYDSAYALARAEIDLYYPYVPDQKLEQIGGITINDMIILFSRLSNLISKVKESLMKNDLELPILSVKMSPKEVVRFLKLTTVYSKDQIEAFLELNTSKLDSGKRINLWTRPLLAIDRTYHILMSAVTAPNYSFLTDEWLNSAGFKLEERGKKFERYIKGSLRLLFQKKKYECHIPDKNKFYDRSNAYEEIDLLMNLKEVVVVAEVKCIRYPMECRDTYNNLKILRKAAKQIVRKTGFIEKNKEYLAEDMGKIGDKEIVKVIITNYPIFAGSKIDDIPVIDFYLFDSYIRSGKLTHAMIVPSNADGIIEYGEELYYTNETELCQKMREFIENPPSIEEQRKEIKIGERELTLPTASIHIFQEFVEREDVVL